MKSMTTSHRALFCRITAIIVVLSVCLCTGMALGQEIDPNHKFAWATDAGWVNFKPTHGGVTVYDSHLEGYAWAENVGWIRLGTHEGGSTHNYTNNSPTTYGVNRSGSQLSGFAWSSHASWINFNPAHGGVVINQTTGEFSGYAWSETVGWIKFAGTALDSTTYMVMRSGSSTEPGTLKWTPFRVNQADGDPYVRSSPVLSSDGSVAYFGANDGKVYAVSTVDGTKKWEFLTTAGQPVRSSPAVGLGGTIYVGGNDQKMYAIEDDGTDGTKLWDVGTGGHIWSSPAIGTDGTVYFGVNDHILDAYHANGTLKWSENLSSEVMSSPAIFNDHVYVGTYDGKLHARDVQTGDVKQGFPFQASWIIYSSPAIGEDGTIYFASTDGNVYALNPDGSEKWRRSLGSSTFVFSSPALGYYNLYIGCKYATGGPVMSTPAVAARDSSDELIYVGSYDHYLYAVNQAGTLQWRFQTAGPIYASPNVDQDGTIYVGSHDGRFYAVNGDPNYVLRSYYSWPKFSRDAQNSGRFTSP